LRGVRISQNVQRTFNRHLLLCAVANKNERSLHKWNEFNCCVASPEKLMQIYLEAEREAHRNQQDSLKNALAGEAKWKGLAERLTEALMDMVAQHCYVEKSRGIDFDLESNCLSANADALRLLGELGEIEIDDRGMRVVYGKWKVKP